ncbi:MAG: hypothetical protein ABR575_06890 [Actinomycetota bacterium]
MIAVEDLDGRPGDEVLTLATHGSSGGRTTWSVRAHRLSDGSRLWTRRFTDHFPQEFPRRDSIAIADLRGGPGREVVVVHHRDGVPGTARTTVTALGGSGRVRWRVDLGDGVRVDLGFAAAKAGPLGATVAAMPGVDGDGRRDLLVSFDPGPVAEACNPVGGLPCVEWFHRGVNAQVIDGRDGEVISSFVGDHHYRFVSAGFYPMQDLSGDSSPDIVEISDEGDVTLWSAYGEVHWQRRLYDAGIPAGAELDGDPGTREIVLQWCGLERPPTDPLFFGPPWSGFCALNGEDGVVLWRLKERELLGVVGDADGDRSDDLAIRTRGGVAVVSGRNLDAIWRRRFEPWTRERAGRSNVMEARCCTRLGRDAVGDVTLREEIVDRTRGSRTRVAVLSGVDGALRRSAVMLKVCRRVIDGALCPHVLPAGREIAVLDHRDGRRLGVTLLDGATLRRLWTGRIAAPEKRGYWGYAPAAWDDFGRPPGLALGETPGERMLVTDFIYRNDAWLSAVAAVDGAGTRWRIP